MRNQNIIYQEMAVSSIWDDIRKPEMVIRGSDGMGIELIVDIPIFDAVAIENLYDALRTKDVYLRIYPDIYQAGDYSAIVNVMQRSMIHGRVMYYLLSYQNIFYDNLPYDMDGDFLGNYICDDRYFPVHRYSEWSPLLIGEIQKNRALLHSYWRTLPETMKMVLPSISYEWPFGHCHSFFQEPAGWFDYLSDIEKKKIALALAFYKFEDDIIGEPSVLSLKKKMEEDRRVIETIYPEIFVDWRTLNVEKQKEAKKMWLNHLGMTECIQVEEDLML